jgi:hypothetical protein
MTRSFFRRLRQSRLQVVSAESQVVAAESQHLPRPRKRPFRADRLRSGALPGLSYRAQAAIDVRSLNLSFRSHAPRHRIVDCSFTCCLSSRLVASNVQTFSLRKILLSCRRNSKCTSSPLLTSPRPAFARRPGWSNDRVALSISLTLPNRAGTGSVVGPADRMHVLG